MAVHLSWMPKCLGDRWALNTVLKDLDLSIETEMTKLKLLHVGHVYEKTEAVGKGKKTRKSF